MSSVFHRLNYRLKSSANVPTMATILKRQLALRRLIDGRLGTIWCRKKATRLPNFDTNTEAAKNKRS